MKKKMKSWQLIVGCLLCAGITLSMFFARITVNADRMADIVIDIVNDIKSSYQKMNKDEDDSLFNMLPDNDYEDEMAEMKEDFKENLSGESYSRSSFWLIFAGKQSLKDFLQESDREADLDGSAWDAGIEQLSSALLLPRIILFLVYFLPLVLIVIYMLTYRGRRNNTIAIISTWIYFLFAVLSNIIWYVVLPAKGGAKIVDALNQSVDSSELKMVYGMFGGTMSDMVSAMLKRMLIGFTGIGIWLFIIGSVFLLLYSFSLLFMGQKVSAFQDAVYFEEEPLDYHRLEDDFFPGIDIEDEIFPNEVAWESNQYGRQSVATGKIRMTKGSLRGAEIVCKSGEQIVVGRDPSVSDLILSHPKVSRKHFVFQYMEENDCYEIFCFSKNCVCLSTGGKIGMSQSASVARGTKIVLAEGEEEMVLE